jgi:hypothetical protein
MTTPGMSSERSAETITPWDMNPPPSMNPSRTERIANTQRSLPPRYQRTCNSLPMAVEYASSAAPVLHTRRHADRAMLDAY